MIRPSLRDAVRSLFRKKSTTLINLAGLTLGLTACLVIFLIAQYELSFDTFHPNKNRIFRIVGTAQQNSGEDRKPMGFVPNAVPAAIREEISGIGEVAAFHNIGANIAVPDSSGNLLRFEENRTGQIVAAEASYFKIFQYKWLVGKPSVLSEPFRVVLTEERARQFFGDLPPAAVIGREVIYQDSIRVTVSGVVESWKLPSDLRFTDFISFPTIRASQLKNGINLDEWNDFWSASQAFVELPEGTGPARFKEAFREFEKRHYTDEIKFRPALQPLKDLHFDAAYQDNYSRKAHKPTLYGLMAIAGFILLLAAINFVNLATAQSFAKVRDAGIRKLLGSSTGNLIAQFLTETAIITCMGCVLALAFAQPLLKAFARFIPEGMTIGVFNGTTLLFMLSVLVFTTLLAGLYPSWELSSYSPLAISRGLGRTGTRKGSLRRALLVFQFVVSIVFITASIVVSRQMAFMRDKDLGFSADRIVSIRIPWNGHEKQSVLVEKLRQLPGVQDVTKEWLPPMGEGYMVTRFKFTEKGKNPIELDASAKLGDENFVPFYNLRMLAGRNYHRSDSLYEVVINEAFVKALGFTKPQDAIGKTLEWQNGRVCPIVGVVADFHEQSFHEKIEPAFLGNEPSRTLNLGVKLARTNQSTAELVADMQQVWKTIYPDLTMPVSFLDDSIWQLYEKEQKTHQLVTTATGIAIFIATIGLLGLVSFLAEQRVKEIGIRKVLGATVANVVWLLSKDFFRLIVLGLLIASPVAWWLLNNWLKDFAYHVTLPWWVFAAAGAAVILVALVSVGWQTVRMATVNPVQSLKAD